MKNVLLALALALGALHVAAQGTTTRVTLFREFKPALVHLSNGKTLTVQLANVFLKNGALLYKHGDKTMQANMANVVAVDFEGKSYVKIDTLLAERLDTVAGNALYGIALIDFEAFYRRAQNNQQMTSGLADLLSGDLVSVVSIDLSNEGDYTFPLRNVFVFRYGDKFVRAMERPVWNALPKAKRRMYKTIVAQPSFSWVKQESLMQLLKYISSEVD